MSKIISLREANQAFARCIREVEAGEEFVITRNGEPVARLVPIPGRRVLTKSQQAARARARAIMEKGWPIGAGALDRDRAHER
jgi:prevent-host-death family protein